MANTILAANEPVINIPTLKRVVSEMCIKHRYVPIFRGEFGTGKSEGVQQAVTAADAILCDVRLGQYDSVDMRGFPAVDPLTSTTCWYPPSTLPFKGNPRFPADRIVVVFFDEITSASPGVFANAYQLVNEYRLGEHEFGDNVRVCCAGNLDSDRGIVNRIPMPLNNRMLHYRIAVDLEAWCRWAAANGVDPRIIAYHGWAVKASKGGKTGNRLMQWDPEDAEPPATVPTPRTWKRAADIFNAYYNIDPDFCSLNMSAALGEGETTEFMAFLKVWQNLIPISAILKNPKGVNLPDEESLIYATAVSVSGAMDLTSVKPLHTFLTRLAPEYVVMAWQLALARNEALYMSDEFLDVGQRYKVIFDATSRSKAA